MKSACGDVRLEKQMAGRLRGPHMRRRQPIALRLRLLQKIVLDLYPFRK